MRWSGATGAIARCKRVSTGCGRKRRSVPAWPWICGVKPTPKAVNKPSPHSIVHGLDKPGVFTTVSKIGSEAFKNQPVGLGPYRLVSQQPGLDVVLEANVDYWRKTPHVKRLVMKSVPEATTRLAMLKQQEADVAYGIFGPLAEEVRRDPNLKLENLTGQATQWVSFIDQYDAKSPWSDKRVRLAANHAINWPAINDAENLGQAVLMGGIIPRKFPYTLPLEPYGYDPKKAQQLLKEAGYGNGFDAGECSTDTPYASVVEGIVNDLAVVGIRAKVRP